MTMAFGAMQAFEEAGRKPGRDAVQRRQQFARGLARAYRWAPERADGWAFHPGGWAMVMLHDDAQGLALNRDGLRERSAPVLQAIDQAKARRWLKLLERDDYGVDFQRYSAEGRRRLPLPVSDVTGRILKDPA
jgi:hypothetical protein